MAKVATQARKMFQGVSATDAVAAGASLVAVAAIPGAIIQTTPTTGKKFAKIGVGVLTVAGVGIVARSLSPSTAKAAVVAGLGGLILQVLDVAGLNVVKGMPAVRQIAGRSGIRAAMPVAAEGYDRDIITNVT